MIAIATNLGAMERPRYVQGQNPLAAYLERESRAYRERGTPESAFLASQLERIAQLVRWTGARTPEEYVDRMDVVDDTARQEEFERGYEEGLGSVQWVLRTLERHGTPSIASNRPTT